MNFTSWLLLFVLAFMWGGAFVLTAIALHDVPPFTLLLIRFILASGILAIILKITGEKFPRGLRLWGSLGIVGLLNCALTLGLTTWGQLHVSAGLTAIITATIPFFGCLIAHVTTTDERLTTRKSTSVVLGFIGVLIIMGPSLNSSFNSVGWSQLAILGSSLSYALGAIYGKRFSSGGVSPLTITFGESATASLFFIPVSFFIEQPWTMGPISPPSWAAIIGLSVLSTVVAHIIYFRLLASSGATPVLLVNYLVPLFSVGLGYVLLSERLHLHDIFGALVIGAALFVLDDHAILWRRLGFKNRLPD